MTENINTKKMNISWIIGILAAVFVTGIGVGYQLNNISVYQDCRIMGSFRAGEAAFKCEQFSKAVLLVPEKK